MTDINASSRVSRAKHESVRAASMQHTHEHRPVHGDNGNVKVHSARMDPGPASSLGKNGVAIDESSHLGAAPLTGAAWQVAVVEHCNAEIEMLSGEIGVVAAAEAARVAQTRRQVTLALMEANLTRREDGATAISKVGLVVITASLLQQDARKGIRNGITGKNGKNSSPEDGRGEMSPAALEARMTMGDRMAPAVTARVSWVQQSLKESRLGVEHGPSVMPASLSAVDLRIGCLGSLPPQSQGKRGPPDKDTTKGRSNPACNTLAMTEDNTGTLPMTGDDSSIMLPVKDCILPNL